MRVQVLLEAAFAQVIVRALGAFVSKAHNVDSATTIASNAIMNSATGHLGLLIFRLFRYRGDSWFLGLDLGRLRLLRDWLRLGWDNGLYNRRRRNDNWGEVDDGLLLRLRDG